MRRSGSRGAVMPVAPVESDGVRASASRLARSAAVGVVEPGLRGPDGDAEALGDLGSGQAEVVVEDEHGPLLEGESPEGSLELVAVVDGQDLSGVLSILDGQEPDIRRPTTATPGLGVALVGQDPMEPGLEAIGIAQRSQLTPGRDERGLHGVLGQVGVAQDPTRDRHAPIADHAGQGVEGLAVAPLRAVHERSMHPSPSLDDRSQWTRSI